MQNTYLKRLYFCLSIGKTYRAYLKIIDVCNLKIEKKKDHKNYDKEKSVGLKKKDQDQYKYTE